MGMIIFRPQVNPEPRRPQTLAERLREAQERVAALAYALEHIQKLQELQRAANHEVNDPM